MSIFRAPVSGRGEKYVCRSVRLPCSRDNSVALGHAGAIVCLDVWTHDGPPDMLNMTINQAVRIQRALTAAIKAAKASRKAGG